MKRPDMSRREEANAITCWAFRNEYIEHLHAGESSKLLENDSLSRITDSEMKKLMIETSEKMEKILDLKVNDPEEYWRHIDYFLRRTWNWVK